MAYFKISLLTPSFTDYTNFFQMDTISEFYPQLDEYNSNNRCHANPILNTSANPSDDSHVLGERKSVFCYSYNEKFTKHQNAQKTLTFSLNKFITVENEWQENPFARNIQIGSQILLEDQYYNQYFFTVTSIKYDIHENNIIYDVSCQDTFSYQTTRQNDGFSITNDPNSEDFIGALTVDEWIIKYIIPQCHIPYYYLTLTEGLYRSTNGRYYTYNVDDELTNVDTIIKQAYRPEDKTGHYDQDYFETIPFSCSGTNANAALISLADQIDFQLQTCEVNRYINNQQYCEQYFWLEPKKNDKRLGLTYSPHSSLQSFGLTHSGDALTTILNVSGPTYNDEIITLFPNIPNFFYQYFLNEKLWNKNTGYYPGMFTALCSDQYYYNLSQDKALQTTNFYAGSVIIDGSEPNWTSMLNPSVIHTENKLYIPVWTGIKDNYIQFDIPFLYQHVEFKRLEDYTSFSYGDHEINAKWFNFSFLVLTTDDPGNPNSAEKTLVSRGDSGWLPNLKNYTQAWIVVDYHDDVVVSDILNFIGYLDFYRDVSEEDLEFAKIADACPWLENKLIDFSYFYKNRILSKEEYNQLLNVLSNDLRVVNGRLMAYAQAYYNALHERVNLLANLTAELDMIGATCQANIINPLAEDGVVKDISEFINAYNAFDAKPQRSDLLNRNDLLTDYFNKYADAQQRFLKNIYKFREFFTARNTLNKTNLYKYYFNLINQTFDPDPSNKQNEYTIYSFTSGHYSQIGSNFNIYKKNTETPLVPIFKVVNGLYRTTDVVDAINYTKYLIQDPRADQFVAATSYNEANEYYERLLEIEITKRDNGFYYKNTNTQVQLTPNSSNISLTQIYPYAVSPTNTRYKLVDIIEKDELYYLRCTPFVAHQNTTETPTTLTIYNNLFLSLVQDVSNISYRPVTSNIMINNWMQGQNLSQYHWNKDPIYVSVDILRDRKEQWNSSKDWLFIDEDTEINSGGVDDKDILDYGAYLPLDKFYWYGPKFKIDTKIQDGKTCFNYKRYNANNEDQKAYWLYLIGENEKPVDDPYEYVTYNPIPFVTANNASAYFRMVRGKSRDYFGKNSHYRNCVPGTSGVTRRDVFGYRAFPEGETKHKEAKQDYRDYADYLRYTANTSVFNWQFELLDDLKNITTYQKQISNSNIYNYYNKMQINNDIVTGTNNTLVNFLFREEGSTRKLSPSLSVRTDVYGALASNYGYTFSSLLNAHSAATSKLYYIDNKWFPLSLDSMLNADNKYMIVYIKDGDESICRNENITSALNHLKIDDNDNFIYEIANYQYTSFAEGLDISGLSWDKKHTLREVLENNGLINLVQNDDTSITANFSSDNGETILVVYRVETFDRTILTPLALTYSVTPTFYNSLLNVYNEDNAIVDLKQAIDSSEWTQGYYYANVLEDTLITPTEWDNAALYYQKKNDKIVQVPTLRQIMDGTKIYYYMSNTYHEQYSLNQEQDNFDLPIVKTKYIIEWNDDDTYTIQSTKQEVLQNTYNCKFESYVDDQAISTLIIDNDTIQIQTTMELIDNLSGLTNGTFWYNYHNRLDIPPLFEFAATIETQLETFWSQAYTASKYCEYFLPEKWQTEAYQKPNFFSNNIFFINDAGVAELKNDYLPLVSIYKDNSGLKQSTKYRFEYINSKDQETLENSDAIMYVYNNRLPQRNKTQSELVEEILDNPSFSKADTGIFSQLNETINNWKITEYGYTTYYYVSDKNTGTLWNRFVQVNSPSHNQLNRFSGHYVMAYRKLKEDYEEAPYYSYERYQQEHNMIWNNLFKQYGYLLLENSYQSSTATTSSELLHMAQYAFKDYAKPESAYSLTTIDVAALQGYQGQEIRIGDGIRVNAGEMYNEYDQIFDSLSEYLFITDLSYTLRSSTDISVTVNAIKYQDKLIQRLVKLIK